MHALRAARVGGKAWFGEVTRAYAAVVFSGRSATGVGVAAATCLQPSRGLYALVAVVTAEVVARRLAFRADLRERGYYGFNALLTGLALAHDNPPRLDLFVLILAASVAATALTAVLGELCSRIGLPVLALPYLVTATLLTHTTLGPHPAAPWLAGGAIPGFEGGMARGLEILASVGAAVFEPTWVGGVVVLASVLLWSRWLALALAAGATLGVAVAHCLGAGAPSTALAAGYNAALTAAALGVVLFVPDRRSLALSALGAGLAAWLSVAWLAPLAPAALPVLAWPFVLVTLAATRALALRGAAQSPWPAILPQATPEANLGFIAMSRTRLGRPGPPQFLLPVGATEPEAWAGSGADTGTSAYRSGPPLPDSWVVTQGMRGEVTHRTPWEHALDFEVIDRDGFPFRGHGLAVEDYYCFGQPVLAAGAGTVTFVRDDLPDNPPGVQDTTQPWGNVVVLAHGPGLYSVVAHLRRGSVRVRVGDVVVAGQAVGACGASGRSPRPHLHFQAQATPELGAPTLDFRLVNYCTRGREADRFHRQGVPREGVLVGPVAVDPLLSALAELAPGRTLELESTRGAACLRCEVSLIGEHALVDDRRGERLYFLPTPAGAVFTTLEGAPRGPLGVLYQTLPFLPAVQSIGVPLRLVEELPASALLPGGLRLAYDVLRVFADPLSSRVRIELRSLGDAVAVSSEVTVSLGRWVVRRRRGQARVDRSGLSLLEQIGGPRWARPPLPELRSSATAAPDQPYVGSAGTCVPAS